MKGEPGESQLEKVKERFERLKQAPKLISCGRGIRIAFFTGGCFVIFF